MNKDRRIVLRRVAWTPDRRWSLRLFITLCLVVIFLVGFCDLLVKGWGTVTSFGENGKQISTTWSPGRPVQKARDRFANIAIHPISPHSHSSEIIEKSFTCPDSDNTLGETHKRHAIPNRADLRLAASRLDVTVEQYVSYSKAQTCYNERLASFSRHQYRSKAEFLTYGESLSKVRSRYRSTSGPKKIFPWTNFEGWIRRDIECAGGVKCVSSTNQNDFMDSDVVIVHIRDIKSKQDLPKIRHPHQIWLYFLIESPHHTGHDLRQFNGIFNWTVTYRRDSDVVYPYFIVQQKQNPLSDVEYGTMMRTIMDSKKKNYLVAYMNSNCDAGHTERLKYIEELKKYIPVDMYGKCGTLNCPRNSPECDDTMKRYKFYLSMENSNCRDYVTEKAAQPLFDWNSVPVVMGADDPGNYAELLPPNSYIHTSGFKSPKDLAEYLLLLDAHPALYEKYHRWRITHEGTKHDMWCLICEKLQDESLPSQTYTDFIGWYNQDTCRTDIS